MWTPREFQTVGAAAQNALAANDIVAGCCCERRAEVERIVLDKLSNTVDPRENCSTKTNWFTVVEMATNRLKIWT